MAMFTFDFRALVLAAILTAGNIILCNSAETSSSMTSKSTTSGGIIENVVPPCLLNRDSVTLVMYSKDHPEGIDVNETDTNIVLNPDERIYLIAHGFVSEANSSSIMHLAQNLLQKKNQNIIAIDWSDQACNGKIRLADYLAYPKAVDNVNDVGFMLGGYTVAILKKCNRPAKDVTLIGHSLGAHLVGYAAKKIRSETNQTVGMIVGLDPAEPGFATNKCDNRLCKTDAEFTTVFRTSVLGATQDDGIDVFTFNGGLKQPGCGIDVSCSHSRSIEYLTHSLDSDCEFIGRPKGSWGILPIPVSQCTAETCSVAGLESYKYPARGNFAVTTSDAAPYCQNHESLI